MLLLLLIDDLLFMVNDNGIVICLDIEIGDIVWMEWLGGNISLFFLYVDGKIYVGD